jgi:hypothetical protein
MSNPGSTRRERRRSHRRRAAWIVVAAVVVLAIVVGGIVVLASGGDDDDGKQASTTGTTQAGPSDTTDPGTTATTRAETPAKTAGPPGGPCKAADVTPAPGGSTVRGNYQVMVVALENTGGRQCTMDGFPELALLGPGGDALQATVTQGGGGVRPELTQQAVTVDPGARASFVMAWDPVTGSCLDVRSFEITLPGDSKAAKLESSVSVCGGGTVNVSPIQPGVVSP